MSAKEKIAERVAKELKDGDVVNLGIGLPTFVSNYIPKGVKIHLQSENGIIGMGQTPNENNIDYNIVNAGGRPITVEEGACFFDSAMSFTIIRGGHVNVSVLGGLQVDEDGNLASHIIPGIKVPGMGGAMDLAAGSKKIVLAMTHTTKNGEPKILRRITLPPTAVRKVNKIITELAVIEVTSKGLRLLEIAEGKTFEEVQDLTEGKLHQAEELIVF